MTHKILPALGLRALRTGSVALASGIGCAFLWLGKPRVPRRWRSAWNAGSAAVEFAITAPVLVALVIGGADYSIMANKQDALEAATRAGAEYARAKPNDPITKDYVTGYTTFSPALNSFTCTPGNSCVKTVCTCADGSSPAPNSCAGACNVGNPPDARVFQYVSITATQSFSALLAWNAFGIAFGFPATLSATTVTRLQ
jgi:Flp pilus assembly protein TadG